MPSDTEVLARVDAWIAQADWISLEEANDAAQDLLIDCHTALRTAIEARAKAEARAMTASSYLRNLVRLFEEPATEDSDDLADILTRRVVALRRERDAANERAKKAAPGIVEGSLTEMLAGQQDRIRRLGQERDAARADAERLEWLIAQQDVRLGRQTFASTRKDHDGEYHEVDVFSALTHTGMFLSESPREAIDQARAAQPLVAPTPFDVGGINFGDDDPEDPARSAAEEGA